MNAIVDRLVRMKEKQRLYRRIVLRMGRREDCWEQRKRHADIVFLHRYAGWGLAKLGRQFGVSPQRIDQICRVKDNVDFPTFCHPKGSCL